MGCPHMGENRAAWTAFLGRLASVSSRLITYKPDTCINIQGRFLRMLEECESKGEGKDMRSYCFHEVLPMDDEIGVLVPKHFATRSPTDNAAL